MNDDPDGRADALRYLILQRLVPALRHAVLGEIQTIRFSAELGMSLLRKGEQDRAAQTLERIPQQCDETATVFRSIVDWLRPPQERVTTIGAGIQQCIELAGHDWGMRRIEVTTELPAASVCVVQRQLRELVVAGLLFLVDRYRGPVDINVVAEEREGGVQITLRGEPADRSAPLTPVTPYRQLECDDLRIFARLHDIACSCGERDVLLQLAKADPT